MDEYSTEASVDMVQALRRALASYDYRLSRSTVHLREQAATIKPAVQRVVRQIEGTVEKLDKSAEKLIDVTIRSHDILFRANTVFPFILFPDTVTVDREKLTIANRFFFSTAKITSVPIRDILSVEADIGPLFGSVYMTSRYFYTNPHSINFLRRRDAVNLQRLLQGYIIIHEQHLDCSQLDKAQLKILLEDLGRGDTD